MITRKKLVAIKGLSEAKVDKIKEAALKMSANAEAGGFMTALQVWLKNGCLGFAIPNLLFFSGQPEPPQRVPPDERLRRARPSAGRRHRVHGHH